MPANVNIFEKYGIKEVANVYFEALETDLASGVYKGDIVLYLDSLKVSTIETSAEDVAAQGGWGNPRLVVWDYNKEINLTLEDALISLESLRFMLGGAIHRPEAAKPVIVHHAEEVVCIAGGVVPKPAEHLSGVEMTITASETYPVRCINLTTGLRTQLTSGTLDGTKKINFKNPAAGAETPVASKEGDHILLFWDVPVQNTEGAETAIEVTISPDTFPGTYRVVGDTFMRSEKTGKDEAFQFVINKAKVLSNVTITLEAEGDPSTFEMQLQVLRATNERGEKEMMKLVRYALEESTSGVSGDDIGSIVSGSGD